jgi:putative transposase
MTMVPAQIDPNAAFEWVDWFDHRRLLEPIGNMPPAEAEARYHATMKDVPQGA